MIDNRPYTGNIFGHQVQGFIAGILITIGDPYLLATGLVILGTSMVDYQWAGFAKLKDTVKKDKKDYIQGLYPGLIIGAGIRITMVIMGWSLWF